MFTALPTSRNPMSTRVRLRSSMIEMPAPKSTAMSTTRVSEAVIVRASSAARAEGS